MTWWEGHWWLASGGLALAGWVVWRRGRNIEGGDVWEFVGRCGMDGGKRGGGCCGRDDLGRDGGDRESGDERSED